MRAERRWRGRVRARGRRWVRPARCVPARGSAAVGVVGADPIVVCSHEALREMRGYLLSADRVLPVVGLARSLEADAPVLAAERVRAVVGAGPRIYYLPGESLLRRLQGSLGQRLALVVGGVRVWWPGLECRCDPGGHPLVLELDGESRAELLVEFARRFDLSRPLVRGEIAAIEDARRLAERELSQAREQIRGMRLERDRALARAERAERALQAAALRRGERDRGGRR